MILKTIQSARYKRASLTKQIRRYEARYEMSSDEMRQELSAGREKETAEKLKWMQAYRVRQFLNTRTNQ